MTMERREWDFERARKVFEAPLMDLLMESQRVHRENFDPHAVQISTLLSIKTGSCSENCSYCAQSACHNRGLKPEPLMTVQDVRLAAERARERGSTRFCMGASGRGPSTHDIEVVCEMVREIKKLGMEACVTLGMLRPEQARKLKEAGLDYYNHNIDTSEEYYPSIVTTRTFSDRLKTLEHVQKEGIKVCCGGILGMGESNDDRIKMLCVLANFQIPPASVPINRLIPIPGTPLESAPKVCSIDFVRTIGLARQMLPSSYIRLSAGREEMSIELQAMCFFAGANAIFYGDKLLTTDNVSPEDDDAMLGKLGMYKVQRAS